MVPSRMAEMEAEGSKSSSFLLLVKRIKQADQAQGLSGRWTVSTSINTKLAMSVRLLYEYASPGSRAWI